MTSLSTKVKSRCGVHLMEAVEAEVSKLCERLLNVQDTENSPGRYKFL